MTVHSDLQVLIPIYNDWESAAMLLPMVEKELRDAGVKADFLLVDDGSSSRAPDVWPSSAETIRGTVRVLRLRRNLGHQRAICVSLCHLCDQTDCQRVLVMDGDGEDSPADIPQMLRALEESPSANIVFAERKRRSEGWLFSFFYNLYCGMHWLLVGHRVRVGNFSVMNRECLESTCISSDLWNHYAASVVASRQSMAFVPTDRATRLTGSSKMNFSGLVMHGMSALSVFSDRISTRMLIFTASMGATAFLGMIMVVLIKFLTNYAIPGWASGVFGILALLLVQIVAFEFMFCFLVLFSRGSSPFLPLRDYSLFIGQVNEVRYESNS